MAIAIWAPHPDDEIIGCYSVLVSKLRGEVTVFFGELDEGVARSVNLFGFVPMSYPSDNRDYFKYDIVYAPDPSTDFHPRHQALGHSAQLLFRLGGIKRLIHYTTSMQAPYIFEVKDPEGKRNALSGCYPEKSDLWRYDHRYWLFEGYNEWHRLNHV
jgi:LmbE family N-acetylglucosaminyl deacetylase